MLETLAGRIKWEKTEEGIRVVIPARFSSRKFLRDFFLEIWVPAVLYAMCWHFMASRDRWAMALGWVPVSVIGVFLLMLTARTVLLLDPSLLTIEFRSFWRMRSKSKFPTKRLDSLRFVDASNREEIRNNYRQSEMQIDEDLRTHPFAEGITEPEALALIGKMMEVYSFPKSPAQV